MELHRTTALTRACEAIQIPSGERMLLEAGTGVRITQSLGGSFTVTTDHGYMVRIAGADADALGMESQATPTTEAPTTAATPAEVEEKVWEQLRTCYDPEIPVNVVDLGLVYDCVLDKNDDGQRRVKVTMTLTAPGCGMGDILVDDVRNKLEQVPTVAEADVELTFDPPWNHAMMSDVAKLETGML